MSNPKELAELVILLVRESDLQGVSNRVSLGKIERIAKALLDQNVDLGDVAIMAAIVGATA